MGTARAAAILGLPQETVRLFVLLVKSLKNFKTTTDVPQKACKPVNQEKLLEELMNEYSQRL